MASNTTTSSGLGALLERAETELGTAGPIVRAAAERAIRGGAASPRALWHRFMSEFAAGPHPYRPSGDRDRGRCRFCGR